MIGSIARCETTLLRILRSERRKPLSFTRRGRQRTARCEPRNPEGKQGGGLAIERQTRQLSFTDPPENLSMARTRMEASIAT